MTEESEPKIPQQRASVEEGTAKVEGAKTSPPISVKRMAEAGNRRFLHWPIRGKCPTCGVWGVCDELKALDARLDEEGTRLDEKGVAR